MDWKAIVGTVAPGIATALGGPLAGLAVGALSKALLGTDDGTEEDVAIAMLQANPEALARVKEAEFEFKAEMKKLDIDLERIHGADRDSARDMAKSTSLNPQMILGTVFIGGFVFISYGIFSGTMVINPDLQPIMNVVLGIMAGAVTQILNFFFGSSSGSKEKTAALVKR